MSFAQGPPLTVPNYTGCLLEGTPTEMQLFQGSEVSAALTSSIWIHPILLHKMRDAPSSCCVSCICEQNVSQEVLSQS